VIFNDKQFEQYRSQFFKQESTLTRIACTKYA